MFLLCEVLVRDVEGGGGGKIDVQVVEGSIRERIPGGPFGGAFDHLGCSGVLGRRVEGGVQVRGLHVTSLDMTCRGRPHCSKRSRCPPSLGSLLLPSPSLVLRHHMIFTKS